MCLTCSYHMPTLGRLPEDANEQLNYHGISGLKVQASPCNKLTPPSRARSEARSTFPSGKATGENNSALQQRRIWLTFLSLLITAQGLSANQPSLQPQHNPFYSKSPIIPAREATIRGQGELDNLCAVDLGEKNL